MTTRQGIYMIVAPSGDFYVGGSSNVERRFAQHRCELRRGRHHSTLLQAACNQQGIGVLKMVMIASVPRRADLAIVEQAVIDDRRPSLNVSMDTHSPMRDPAIARRNAESIRDSAAHRSAREKNQKRAAKAISRRVVRLTDGLVFESGYEAARACGAEHMKDQIYTAIKNGWRFGGHFWKREGDPLTLEQAERKAAEREEARVRKCAEAQLRVRAKPVMRVSDGKVWPSISSAARDLECSHTGIHRAVREGSNCMGSRWAYV